MTIKNNAIKDIELQKKISNRLDEIETLLNKFDKIYNSKIPFYRFFMFKRLNLLYYLAEEKMKTIITGDMLNDGE